MEPSQILVHMHCKPIVVLYVHLDYVFSVLSLHQVALRAGLHSEGSIPAETASQGLLRHDLRAGSKALSERRVLDGAVYLCVNIRHLHADSTCDLQVILSLTNNWNSTGSVDQFVSWSPSATVHEDFFKDPTCMQLYQQYVAAILNRVNYINGRRWHHLTSWDR